MKPKFRPPSLAAWSGVILAFTCADLHATPYYWDTTTTGTWATGANWSDNAVSGGTTGTVPLSTDTAVFNQSTVNGTEILQLDANHSIAGITFANTGTTLINSDSATPRILTLGSGGLTINSGADAVTLGDATNVMNLSLSAAQSWTNNSAKTLTAVNGLSLANTGAQILTVTGSGNSTLSGAIINGSGTLGLTKTGAGTLTLSGANTYTGNTIVSGGTLNVASGGSLTNISALNTRGGGAMTISGTVTIASNGSFGVGAGVTGTTGSLTLNTGGTLNIGSGGGFTGIGGKDITGTGLGNGTLTVAGGTLNVAAPGTTSNGLDATNFWMNPYGTGGGTSTVNLDGGVISTLRTFAYGGSGTAVFNLNGGTLQAASGYTGGLFSGLTRVNVRNGGAVINTNGNNNSVTSALLHSNIGGDATVDGGLTKQGIGILTLSSNANSFNGNINITGGTLQSGAGLNAINPTTSPLGNPQAAGRTITIGSGTFLSFTGNDSLGAATSNVVVKMIVNGGTISNSGNFFTTLGPVDLNAGTINSVGGAAAAYPSFQLGGTITVGGSAASSISGSGTNSQMLLGSAYGANTSTTFNVADATSSSASDLNVSVVLQNSGGNNGLIKSGVGTMTLSGANTYTGTTTISAGTLRLANQNAVQNSTLTMNGGGLVFDSSVGTHAFTFGGLAAATAGAGRDISLLDNASNAVTLTVGGNNAPTTYAGVLSGTGGSLTKAGTGTLTLSGANSYTGATTISANGGVLKLANVNAIQNSASVSVASGTTLQFSGAGTYVTAGTISVAGTGSTAISANSGALWFGQGGSFNTTVNAPINLTAAAKIASYGNTMSQTLGGQISGGVAAGNTALTIQSQGGNANADVHTWTLNAASNYTGNTIFTESGGVLSNTLKLGVTNALPTATTLTLAPATAGKNTRLDLNGQSQQLAGLLNTGTATQAIVFNSGAGTPVLTINNSGANAFTGLLGTGGTSFALTKNGAGILSLSAANTYTGATTVNQGTLKLATGGSIANSSSVAVKAGAILDVSALSGWTLGSSQTLTGSGGVTGATTISGTHKPGDAATNNGVGSQAFSAALTYANGSIFEWDLNESSITSGFDKISANGNIQVGTTNTIFKIIFGSTALNEIYNMNNAFWNTPHVTRSWSMASIFGQAFTSGAFQSFQTSNDVSSYGTFSINGTSLTWQAVPEPTSALAGLLLTAGLLRRRR